MVMELEFMRHWEEVTARAELDSQTSPKDVEVSAPLLSRRSGITHQPPLVLGCQPYSFQAGPYVLKTEPPVGASPAKLQDTIAAARDSS